ncbi:MAG: DNA polymerase III subunit gamma/tau [Saprospiraceae bacterium]
MSQFVVSARKYRPIRFEEVVGQGHISQTLKHALQTDHLAHAFLFCGPRGVGKTTCARILAKAINCENPNQDFEPCGVCNSCAAFNENASFNIFELDAASNNSVDHIRALNEQVRFAPQMGKFKVFIIDEVHMLSSSAFNAFLKTLEEPPPYAIFILATTEKHKILPTILSRCQIYDFRRILIADIVSHLQYICKQEKIEAEDEALHVIAQKADGALRDALSIFDRIVSSAGNHVTYQSVIQNLNLLDYEYFFQATDAILSEDLGALMLLYDEVLKKGFEGDQFMSGLASHLRELLVCKQDKTIELLEVPENLRKRYWQQSKLAPMDLILSLLDQSNSCDLHFGKARNKRLHTEIYLMRMAYLTRMVTGHQVVQETEEKKTPSLSESAPKLDKKAVEAVIKGEKAPIEAEIQETPIAVEIPKKEVKQKSVSPRLNSLDSIMNQVKTDEAKSGDSDAECTAEQLAISWENYRATLAAPSLNLLMSNHLPVLNKKVVEILVGTKIARMTIMEETALLDTLRREMKSPGLLLRVDIDPSIAPPEENVVKPLNTQEKYLHLQKINPQIDQLVKALNLKIEE